MAFPNWSDRLEEDVAKSVIANGKHFGDGAHAKDCFWRGYRLNGGCYIGLNGSSNLWETDEQTMLDHCLLGQEATHAG